MYALALCTVGLLPAPRAAFALELGAIEARSLLYEPLNARIALHDAGSGDRRGLTVTLGTPAQFELAGVAREDVLKLLRFDVVEESDGGAHVRVWTGEPIIEPSLTFLVSAEWARGRTIRGYHLTLEAGAAGVASPLAEAPAPTSGGTGASSVEREPAPPATGEQSETGGTTYGPVRRSETLWSIASRVRPDTSISVQRMMLALLEANPGAFAFGNINALNAGTTLRVPTLDELGPTDQAAAVAEVQRQHSAWERRGAGRQSTPAPSTEAPSPGDAEPKPGGRIELVAPESEPAEAAPDEHAATEALRTELALATEEADAGRRQSDELKLRLAEAEFHIKELSRLVELKNEEIAALQAKLRALGTAEPGPAAGPTEAERVPAPAEDEPGPAPTAEQEPEPALTAEEEPKPVMAGEEKPKPIMTPPDEGSEPVQAQSEVESTPAPEDAGSLPFDLDALRVNPVFLVGGAGILLILLGIVALLRRRRSQVDDADAPGSTEDSPSGDDNILLELEAVAAGLADEAHEAAEPRDRRTRAAPESGHSGDTLGEALAEVRDSEVDHPTEHEIAELWRDTSEAELERADRATSHQDEDDSSLGFEALTRDDREPDPFDDERGDEFDIGSLADIDAQPAAEPSEADEETPQDLESLFREHDAEAAGSEAPGGVPASGTGESPDGADGRRATVLVLGDDDSPDADSVTAGTDRAPSSSELASVDASDDVETGSMPPDDVETASIPLDDMEPESMPLDDVGDDEVQTKIDLAQVYMEMGDYDSARGFLEAVLADGDDDQREVAREMLSKLT